MQKIIASVSRTRAAGEDGASRRYRGSHPHAGRKPGGSAVALPHVGRPFGAAAALPRGASWREYPLKSLWDESTMTPGGGSQKAAILFFPQDSHTRRGESLSFEITIKLWKTIEEYGISLDISDRMLLQTGSARSASTASRPFVPS
jgi:hypothetical protein